MKRHEKQYNKEVDAYKYFILDVVKNRIVSGWEFLNDAKDELKEFEKGKAKIISKSRLKSLGFGDVQDKMKYKETTTKTTIDKVIDWLNS